eukprot:6207437-Pleurochrysis_carterae.AAC.3
MQNVQLAHAATPPTCSDSQAPLEEGINMCCLKAPLRHVHLSCAEKHASRPTREAISHKSTNPPPSSRDFVSTGPVHGYSFWILVAGAASICWWPAKGACERRRDRAGDRICAARRVERCRRSRRAETLLTRADARWRSCSCSRAHARPPFSVLARFPSPARTDAAPHVHKHTHLRIFKH